MNSNKTLRRSKVELYNGINMLITDNRQY